MKKLIVLCIMFVFIVALVPALSAEGNSPVYTFTLTDLGQGAWGGGPLFADGSAGGHVFISVLNGQVQAHLDAVSWSEIVPGESIDICFNVDQTKGPTIFPPYFCTSSLGIVLPVSGTPVVIANPRGDTDLLIRVTPAT